ncbi:hypothetical protein TWF506_008811 [Arthrobotrys conoides]|uniref:Uncharacterized protein n=1 Tax=Arthrobotrys conoides TaxID=74498 RepID=A0AAN8NP38_9PEZI
MPPPPHQQTKLPKSSRRQSHSQTPISPDPKCRALHKDGADCLQNTSGFSDYCPSHNKERKELRKLYKQAEKQYDAIEINEGGLYEESKIEGKLAAGNEALKLRDQVNRRFYSFSADNSGHNQWILKLQNEIQNLEERLLAGPTGLTPLPPTEQKLQNEIQDLERRLSAEAIELTSPLPTEQNDETITSVQDQTIAFRPPLNPAQRISGLFYFELPIRSPSELKASVERVYEVAPSLNDSTSALSHKAHDELIKPSSPRDTILQFLFREVLLHRGNREELSRAIKTPNINDFIYGCEGVYHRSYLGIFDRFQDHLVLARHFEIPVFHCLRDAICDYISNTHPPPPSSPAPPSLTILGAKVIPEGTPRRMDIAGWDCLWTNFKREVQWTHQDIFAIQFEDLVTVKALTALKRYEYWDFDWDYLYSDPDDDICNSTPYPWNPDTSKIYRAALLQGFIPIEGKAHHKSLDTFYDHKGVPTARVVRELEKRGYLVGMMSKTDSNLKLATELKRRIGRLVVLLFDLEKEPTVPILSPTSDPIPWIERQRLWNQENGTYSHWVTNVDAKAVLANNKHPIKTRSLAKDCYVIIIIEREKWQAMHTDILKIVTETLSELNGNRSHDQIIRWAIQKYIPIHEQTEYLRKFFLREESSEYMPPGTRYIGNRVRSWNTTESFRDSLDYKTLGYTLGPRPGALSVPTYLPQITGHPGSQFVSDILADLEAHNIITPILDFGESDTFPIVVPGTDGLDDLYFRYTYEMFPEYQKEVLARSSNLGPRKNLFQFAKAHMESRGGVFGKGRINFPYCAWPLPISTVSGLDSLNFQTREGHIYKWNFLPFDLPGTSLLWQQFIDREINDKLPHICIVDTTVLVCAESWTSIDTSIKALLDIGKKHNLSFSIPSPALWTPLIRLLELDSLWEGVRPALEDTIFMGTKGFLVDEIGEDGAVLLKADVYSEVDLEYNGELESSDAPSEMGW